MNITPLFEFGFGLSYTTFSYSSLNIDTLGTSQVITFTLSNTGSYAGTEIAQLYLAYPADVGEPPMVLRGFEEVELDVGASSRVSIVLNEREMRYVDGMAVSAVKV